ncbi:MAG: hypothetical protein Kow0069_08170 [Promethearchaeota archaeon]
MPDYFSELPPYTHVPNPGFEEWDADGDPVGWQISGSGTGFSRQANFTAHGGTNSSWIQVQGRDVADYYQIWQDLGFGVPADDNVSLSLWWNVSSIWDAAVNREYAGVALVFDSGNYLYYYCAGYSAYNQSNNRNLNFTGAGTLNAWVQSSVNVTADYEAWFDSAVGVNLTTVVVRAYSTRHSQGPVNFFVDDVVVRRNFGANEVVNPGFDDDDPVNDILKDWMTYSDYYPGKADQSTNSKEGASSLRLEATTGKHLSAATYSGINVNHGYETWRSLDAEGPTELTLWWQLEAFEQGAYYPQAYLMMTANNGSGNLYAYAYFASWSSSLQSNSSNAVHFKLDGFNETGTWHHARLNLLDVFSLIPGVTSVNFSYLAFNLINYQPGSRVVLLVDDLRIEQAPVPNGGFEQVDAWNLPKHWPWQKTDPAEVATTSAVVHGGSNALNLSASANGDAASGQNDVYLPLTNETTLELYWRLERLVGTNQWTLAAVEVEFRDANDANLLRTYYFLGTATGDIPYSNSSVQGVYVVAGFSETGQWNLLRRDLWWDLKAATGTNPEGYHVDTFGLYVSSNFDGDVCALFDGVRLGETSPLIESQSRDPVLPSHHQEVSLTLVTFDVGGVSSASFNYSVDGGQWTALQAVPLDANNTVFQATLPAQPYGSNVSYFATVVDHAGHETQSGVDWYVVGDTLPPSIDGLDWSPRTPSAGRSIVINVSASDGGSGVNACFVFFTTDFGQTWANASLQYTGFNYTGSVPGFGAYSVASFYVVVVDAEGNQAVDDNGGLFYRVVFRERWSVPTSFLYGMAAGVGAALAAIGTGVGLRARAKKKARTPPPAKGKPKPKPKDKPKPRPKASSKPKPPARR